MTAIATTTTPSNLLRIADLTAAQLNALLDLADEMKNGPGWWTAGADGAAIACLFDKPSTRTRVSFEVAAHRLGMLPIMLRPDELQLGRGEPLADTARVLSSYTAAIVVRTFAQATLEELAGAAGVPVVNALTDEFHPCQILADLLTVRERRGSLAGQVLAYVGDGANNMAHSYLLGGATAGMHVRIGCPEAFSPDPEIFLRAAGIAAQTGGSVDWTPDAAKAAEGADVLATDTWVSMGQEDEYEARIQPFLPYAVDDAALGRAADGAVVLHCLPAYREKEIASSVIDGPQSAVWDEAENRLHAQKALLVWLLEHS
jgi:ornithine carbamoyltransferase